jgi:putative transposase
MVQRFGFIGVEDLDVAGMMRRGPKGQGKSKRGLRRSLGDAGISSGLGWLSCKAEEAGATITRVPPEGTSRACSACGSVKSKEEFPLWVRSYECRACGLVMGRDHNAAVNILARARPAWEEARTGPPWRGAVGRLVEAGSPRL